MECSRAFHSVTWKIPETHLFTIYMLSITIAIVESEFCWLTVNEYLSDELASDSDYEKKNVSLGEEGGGEGEGKAETEAKQTATQPSSSYRTSSSYSPRNERSDDRFEPRTRRLGPCFKLSIPLLLLFWLALFVSFGYGRSYAHGAYPVCSLYSFEPCAIWSLHA